MNIYIYKSRNSGQRVSEREREGELDRERQGDRLTDRQTDRGTDGEVETRNLKEKKRGCAVYSMEGQSEEEGEGQWDRRV